MKEKWNVYAKKADFNAWAAEFGIDPVLARVIRNRDLESTDEVRNFLWGTLADCPSPWDMLHMREAVNAVAGMIRNQKRIRIIGDYDVDGICATYILLSTLRSLGAQVDAAIPHRMKDGYGLNESLIEQAKQDGIEAIITCDNGIAAMEPILLAKEYGMQVVITDHHEIPFTLDGEDKQYHLPAAEVILDPKQTDETYPFPGICGAVVALKLMLALTEEVNPENVSMVWEQELPFAAMATVCDVMELKGENRILVKEGLKRFATCGNPGIQALVKVHGLDIHHLSAYHMGFVLGPCMNATGRLDTAIRALQLLESRTEVEAVALATELKELNESRKALTLAGVEEAEKLLEGKEPDPVILVYLPEVHESLAGIIAGKLKEKYYHPTFVFTNGEDGIKGSGRSIEAYHMYEEMNRVAELFTKFGGHKMAAGCSLDKENLEALRRRLNAQCKLREEDFIPKVMIDVPMPMDYASLELAEQFQILEPFGVGMSHPLFAQKDVVFVKAAYIGKAKNCLRFTVRCGNRNLELMYFEDLKRFEDFLRDKFGPSAMDTLCSGRGEYPITVAYQIGVNVFRDQKKLQYIMKRFC